jgi:hypothetical protein
VLRWGGHGGLMGQMNDQHFFSVIGVAGVLIAAGIAVILVKPERVARWYDGCKPGVDCVGPQGKVY